MYVWIYSKNAVHYISDILVMCRDTAAVPRGSIQASERHVKLYLADNLETRFYGVFCIATLLHAQCMLMHCNG